VYFCMPPDKPLIQTSQCDGTYKSEAYSVKFLFPQRRPNSPIRHGDFTTVDCKVRRVNLSVDDISDEGLVSAAQVRPHTAEAEVAVNELFRRYYSRVALWCLRFTGDRETADDLAQDILLKVYRNLDSFRGNSKFSTWLYAIARNRCMDEVKSASMDLDPYGEDTLAALPDQRYVDVQTALEEESSVEAMRALIRTALDETEQKVLMLHYGHDYTLPSVTRLLGLQNASGAKAYVVSARRKLNGVVRHWETVKNRKGAPFRKRTERRSSEQPG
jgi:RNA polymerase sigma-70 factor, ECF subfamily